MNLTCKSFESEKKRETGYAAYAPCPSPIFASFSSITGVWSQSPQQVLPGGDRFNELLAIMWLYMLYESLYPIDPLYHEILTKPGTSEIESYKQLQTAILESPESLFVARSAPGPFCTMDPRPKLFANPPCNSLTHSFRFVHVLTRFYLSGSAHSFHKSHHHTSL